MDSTQSALLLALGLAPGKVANICRDPDALARVMQLVDAGGLGKTSSLLPHQTGLVASLALNGGSIDAGERLYILRYVLEDEIASQIQLTAALKLAPELKWADPVILREETEAMFTVLFGSRAEQVKTKTKTNAKAASKARTLIFLGQVDTTISSPPNNIFEEGFLAWLHKPGENPQNNDKLRLEHIEATGGKVVTRFPPEPHRSVFDPGYLPILLIFFLGHAKAIAVNFGYAEYHGGRCILRYDDTNPSKEAQLYFDNILATIRWLGIEPDKVTYSSDYFDTLFEKAVELIKKDKAYVCLCTYEERDQGRECVHRGRPVDESLAMFEQMKEGHPDLVNATLRMKQDLEDPNPQMWDLVAYRSHVHAHPRTGTRWKIYPTYDFTHCLVDSFENISHSLCTNEFAGSRQSYEWLCHALEVYTPRQYEYGRLNLTHTVMSKRRLHRLIHDGLVDGWDDIRLPTLVALRRRWVPPEAIMDFVRGLGVMTAMAVTNLVKFEESVRRFLEPLVPRLFLVLRPVKVILENLPDDFLLMVEKPYHPKNPNMGTSTVLFTRVIYIDADDFRVSSSNDYLRLSPGGSVGLLHVPHPITCISFEADDAGNVQTIIAHYHNDGSTFAKPRAFIHWVADCLEQQSPVRVDQARLVGPLFKSPNPSGEEGIDENSLDIYTDAMIDVAFWTVTKDALRASREAARARIAAATNSSAVRPITEAELMGHECVRFQGTRVGYFCLDSDSSLSVLHLGSSTREALVLNRIVSLKDGDASRVAK
ncbi:glutamine-tRNA ligase [Mycena metata]|uniref:glutamine--tRNA ligase n=1 Tax=Mycena metata TaxID=1033252 RepID=A0AAD7HQH3_9AGAR|nr:glutamine-tRNA ligase [Mycena metata]